MINNYIMHDETIIALATPFGKGGIGIIKISGNLSKLASNTFFKKIPFPRKAEFLSFINPDNNEILDKGILIFFEKPNSFTGEDILEFHGHGSPIMLTYLIKIIISKLKIRLALPGEFSSRAFINNKLNLIQAESMIDLIESENIISAKLASKSLQGFLSKKIDYLIKKIEELKILIETLINFSENDNDFKLDKKIKNIKFKLINSFEELLNNYNLNNIIKNGIKISIIGKPNVGKSTLFNALINKDKSIISSISGTTRDSIDSDIWLNNICFKITDTAGIKKTNDELEKLSIQKTIEEIYKSDHILYVIDDLKDLNNIHYVIDDIINNIKINKKKINKIPFTIIKNKSDIFKEKIKIINLELCKVIYISAKKNKGINLIKNYFNIIFNKDLSNINYLINYRQYEYINKSLNILKNDNKDLVILSSDLDDIKNLLIKMSGKNIQLSNNLLNKIFSKFCIGK